MTSEFPLSLSYQVGATKEKKPYQGSLKNFTIGPIQRLLFFLFAALCSRSLKVHCISLTFLAFPFSSILFPASLTIFFLFFPVLFLISSHFYISLVSIFCFHISHSFLKCCALSCVEPLICCLLYLSVPSLVCLVLIVFLMFLFYMAVVFSLFSFLPFWCFLMHFLICQFSSVSSCRSSVCRRERLSGPVSIPLSSFFQQFGVYCFLLCFLLGPHL